ncbi:MAG: HAMP domain-containing protein [Clostridia bacterium]|nr:HAMP domain-containing protein [Clostridia bacterium]
MMKKKRSLLTRVYISVFVAFVLMILLIWVSFVKLSGSVFMNLKTAELKPRAQSLANIVLEYLEGRVSEELLLSLVDRNENDSSVINAYLIITDRLGEIRLASDMDSANLLSDVKKSVQLLQNAESIVRVQHTGIIGEIVVVGVPVKNAASEMVGALFLYVPQYEALAARGALAGSMIIVMLVIAPIIFLLLNVLLYRLIRPLRRMNEVALRMADGQFDLRVNEETFGEIGQLAQSFNRLSITLKKTFSALTFERNRLVQILNGMTEGIAAIDKEGNITHINPALEKLFKHQSSESDPRMRVIAHREVWEAFGKTMETGEISTFQLTEYMTVIHASIAPVRNDSGEIEGAVGVFMDVSKEALLEKTRREYVANVSHEMRSPLTAVRGLIEPLRDGMVTNEDTKKRYYDIILREVLRLSRLISDLMELSRLQSGNLAIEPDVFRLGEMIDDVFDKYKSLCQEKSIELVIESDFPACPPLYANPDRIEQLLGILIDNAVKYTPENGKISLSGDWSGERAVIYVSDTGTGIPKEHLPHLFERFYKVDKAHSGMGSGLGLSIAKEMLTLMGESIEVESEEGKGTTFTFTVRIYDGGSDENALIP